MRTQLVQKRAFRHSRSILRPVATGCRRTSNLIEAETLDRPHLATRRVEARPRAHQVEVLLLRDGIDADVEVVRQCHEMRCFAWSNAPDLVRGPAHAPRDVLRRALAQDEEVRLVGVVRHAAVGQLLRAREIADGVPALHREVDDHVGRRLVQRPRGHLRRHGAVADDVPAPRLAGLPRNHMRAGLDAAVDVARHVRQVLRADRHAIRQDVDRHDGGCALQLVADRHAS